MVFLVISKHTWSNVGILGMVQIAVISAKRCSMKLHYPKITG